MPQNTYYYNRSHVEELKTRYTDLLKIYNRFTYMSKKFVQLQQQEKKLMPGDEECELIACRDSLLKRFELACDFTGKFFKLLLRKKYSLNVTSPRTAFQECYHQNILTVKEAEKFLEMAKIRSKTKLLDNEPVMDTVSKQIVEYYIIFADIAKKITLEQNKL
jgi:hypothetical protein